MDALGLTNGGPMNPSLFSLSEQHGHGAWVNRTIVLGGTLAAQSMGNGRVLEPPTGPQWHCTSWVRVPLQRLPRAGKSVEAPACEPTGAPRAAIP